VVTISTRPSLLKSPVAVDCEKELLPREDVICLAQLPLALPRNTSGTVTDGKIKATVFVQIADSDPSWQRTMLLDIKTHRIYSSTQIRKDLNSYGHCF
jgi:hypothetical protein